jgi:hypothetical protein
MESLQEIVTRYIVNNPREIKKMCFSYLQNSWSSQPQPIDPYVMLPILRFLFIFLTSLNTKSL